jgi:hypothetical protein
MCRSGKVNRLVVVPVGDVKQELKLLPWLASCWRCDSKLLDEEQPANYWLNASFFDYLSPQTIQYALAQLQPTAWCTPKISAIASARCQALAKELAPVVDDNSAYVDVSVHGASGD